MGGHGGYGHKALLQNVIVKGVCGGDNAHPDVMGHIAAYDFPVGGAAAAGCEVQSLQETVAAPDTEALKAVEVAQRAEGIQPQHQKAGIGRDDQIAVLSPLEGQSGASVGFIAIAEPGVEGVKGTLGDAPGAARADTMLLHIEAEAAALIQETSPLIGKKELRHAVFEHGARPTGQTPIAVLLELTPAQPGPVPLRHVALGDGQETGQHGLTGHQVVPATPAPFFHRIVADIKQLSCLVKKQREVHRPQQLIDAFGLIDLAPGR